MADVSEVLELWYNGQPVGHFEEPTVIAAVQQ
jgi:hypothetical protein